MKKKILAGFLAFSMVISMGTNVPVTVLAAEPTAEAQDAGDGLYDPNNMVIDTALARYDFADFSTSEDGASLTDEQNRTIVLESTGGKKVPELVQDEKRGQVLSTTEQGKTDDNVANRGDALLPGNPFAGQSTENGFTINFWTKTTGSVGGGKCLMDFEVAPATDGRAGTYAINQSMIYWNTTDQNANFTDFNTGNLKLDKKNGWTMVTVEVTSTGTAVYRNGEKISHSISSGAEDYEQMISDLAGGLADDPADTNVRLGASLANYWSGAGAYLDEISFYGKALSDKEVSSLYYETVIPVPLESVTVTGASSVDEDKTIQLTASLTPADATVSRKVTWTSSDPETLSIDSNGKAKGLKPGNVTVTAEVAGVKSADFSVTVNDVEQTEQLNEGYYLTVYSTTTPFYASTGNLDRETRSVYFAVSKDGKKFDVLNNGGGVIFASKGDLRITEPMVYLDETGTFTVVARDTTSSKGYHVFTSEDGVHFYNETLQTAKPDYDTAAPLKKSSFTLELKGENILDTDEEITLGNAVALTEAQYKLIVDKLGTVVNTGLEALDAFDVTASTKEDLVLALEKQYPSVNATYSDGSSQKFSIDWSDAASDVALTADGDLELTGKVVQTKYLNNLKELNGSSLPEDDPANVGDEADNYDEETGTNYYDATKFVEGMADPCIYWDEQTGYYYMTGSYFPEDGDAIDKRDTTQQYDRVVLRRAKTLEGLQNRSEQVTVWKVGNQGFDDNGTEKESGYRYIWAPEIHRVGDYWVIYFTESHSSNLFDIYCHALVLDGDKDPYETALTSAKQESEWKDYKMMQGTEGLADPFEKSFCLDMTYFEDAENGQAYVIWAGKPYGNSDLFIAKVDKENPWKVTSAATRLAQPIYGWEQVRYIVNEGPTVLQKDGKIYMCYSASGTGSEYAIGMMTAAAGEDLLSLDNWTKNPYPLLTSRDVDGEEGPGHNSFTVDKDGNTIFVYHARPTSHNYKHCGWDGTNSTYNGEPLNDPCRHARLKRVHWAADGTPILKMTYEEELLEANSTVTVTAHVTKAADVTGVTLDKETLALMPGDEAELKAAVVPAEAVQNIIWSSDDETVATVEDGKVTAKAAGTATITASSTDGKTATCKVTVTDPVASVTLDQTALELKVGDTGTLKATVSPNTADQSILWSSDNAAVATVSADGTVTAKAEGTAVITAAAGGKSASCTVTVTKAPAVTPDNNNNNNNNQGGTTVTPGADQNTPVAVTAVKLNKNKVTLGVKEKFTLTAAITPANATNQKVSWKSNKTSVASVSSKGVVTAKKKGTATITATVDGKKVTCKITVKVAPKKITLNAKSKTLRKGKTFKIKTKLTKNSASNKITYKSSNKKVATVSSSGKVKAVKKGKATITVKTFNGKKATLKITVK